MSSFVEDTVKSFGILVVLILIVGLSCFGYATYNSLQDGIADCKGQNIRLSQKVAQFRENNLKVLARLDAVSDVVSLNTQWASIQLNSKQDQLNDLEEKLVVSDVAVGLLEDNIKSVDKNTEDAFVKLGGQLTDSFTSVGQDIVYLNEQLQMIYQLLPPKESM